MNDLGKISEATKGIPQTVGLDDQGRQKVS